MHTVKISSDKEKLLKSHVGIREAEAHAPLKAGGASTASVSRRKFKPSPQEPSE